jgi:hypothetical protein
LSRRAGGRDRAVGRRSDKQKVELYGRLVYGLRVVWPLQDM